jgi:prepilin-type N-terminal cleavage/methylation domain-containing protein
MKKRLGFTLIELLVVIAIIAILAAILFPIFANAKRAATRARCASNYKQITSALLSYMDDHDDRFPYCQATFKLWLKVEGGQPETACTGPFLIDNLSPYVRAKGVWLCPAFNPDTKIIAIKDQYHFKMYNDHQWKENGGAYGKKDADVASNVMWNYWRPDTSPARGSAGGYSLTHRSTSANVVKATKALMIIELPYWDEEAPHMAGKNTMATHMAFFDSHVKLVVHSWGLAYYMANAGGWDNRPVTAPAAYIGAGGTQKLWDESD